MGVFLMDGLDLLCPDDQFFWKEEHLPLSLDSKNDKRYVELKDQTDQVWRVKRLDPGQKLDLPYRKVSLRTALTDSDMALNQLITRAVPLANWADNHRFCGRCGASTDRRATEYAMVCPVCKAEFYPQICPAVITLIYRGNEVLLARNARFNPPVFSCVAGFVEPGEDPLDTVAREVKEEVGIKIGTPEFVGSQFWPFPNSLMLAYYAPWKSGDPRPDGIEIAEAHWFSKDNLPALPMGISIARKMINQFFHLPEEL